MNIKVNENRLIEFSDEEQGTSNESNVQILHIEIPEKYADFYKKIVFITDDGIFWDYLEEDNTYTIKNNITKYNTIEFYIWLTKDEQDFRSKTYTLFFNENENPNGEVPEEQETEMERVIRILEEEITKAENLNIEVEKIGNVGIISITDKRGVTSTIEIQDGQDGQDGRNGQDGKDGTNGSDGLDGKSAYQIWLDNGNTGTEQDFLNSLKGENGLNGSDGKDGENGVDGEDGYTPQKGVDYFTEQDIEEIETGVKDNLEENVLIKYSLIVETGAKIELSINPTNYKLTAILKDKNNNIIHTSNVIDLPLETMVVNATYDNVNKAIILTLQNGTTVSISVADLVSGLVSESQLQTILSNFYNKTEINNLLNNKVDKVQGKELSTNDFTDALKEKLSSIAEGAQVNVLENLTLEGIALTKNNKTIEIKDPEVTNARLSTTKGKNFESVDARIEELEMDVNDIKITMGPVYGVRRKITNNSSPSWERILDSVGRSANATKDGENVQNDFDSLAPWSEIKSCNYDLNTKEINAWFGDPNFKFDGTNGDVFTYIPKTYWKIYQEDDYDYVLLTNYPKEGFTEINSFFVGRYDCTDIGGKLCTYSGLVPTTSRTITTFRNSANALGSKFSQLDWRYFVIQMLYLVEYATYDSQIAVGNGIMSRNSVNTLIAENSTNRVVVPSNTNFYIGQIIRIGKSANGGQIGLDRIITAVEEYDDGTITGYSVTFAGAPVNIAVGNYVSTCAQQTGQCDILGMKSGCLNNDGYHSVIYRGMENIYGDVFQFVDGINIKDSQVYFCKDHSQYQTDYYEAPYNLLPYVMDAASNGWVKTLGFTETEPILRLPTDIGGSSSTYMCDYYVKGTGVANIRVGGCSSDGQKNGFWALMMGAPAGASWDRACRILIDS